MNPDIAKIVKELKSEENFSAIKDIEKFSEKLYNCYYAKCDIVSEIRKAGIWIEANPNRRKKNYKRFLANWFARK